MILKAFFLIWKWTSLVLFLIALPHCSHFQKLNKISVTLKTEQILEKNKKFKGLKVGGLSELFFDKSSGYFFALSDDKKNHRFYKLKLNTEPCCQFQIKEQIFLKSPGYSKLKRNMDPEAFIISGKHILIASEGQQIHETHEPTQIFTYDEQAVLKEAWPVPPVFWKPNPRGHQPVNFGQQENKGFESLTLDKQSNTLWTATEKPLKQDLIFPKKAFVRLSAFDVSSKKMSAQYAYALHNKKDGGLVSLHFLKPKMFISLERVYKKKKNNGTNFAYLFLTNCQTASNVSSQMKLKGKFKACSKNLLWDSSKDSNFKVDNLEGLALGPILPSKKQLMVLVSDNNFNEKKQKSQFLFFEFHQKK